MNIDLMDLRKLAEEAAKENPHEISQARVEYAFAATPGLILSLIERLEFAEASADKGWDRYRQGFEDATITALDRAAEVCERWGGWPANECAAAIRALKQEKHP